MMMAGETSSRQSDEEGENLSSSRKDPLLFFFLLFPLPAPPASATQTQDPSQTKCTSEKERDKLRFLRDKEMDEKRRRSGQKALNVLQCIFKYL